MAEIIRSNGKVFITLPVTYDQLDLSKALTIREVRAQFSLRGPTGNRLCLDSLRRWANPKRGYRPIGPDGPVVLLPMLKQGAGLWAMPEWVEWFLKQCNQIREANRRKTKFQIGSDGK